MPVVSSWYLDGYGHDLPEVNEKFQEILRMCRLLGLPDPDYCSRVNGYGEEHLIYADELIFAYVKPIYRNDFEEIE